MLPNRPRFVATITVAGLMLANASGAALTPTGGERNPSANATGVQKRPALAAGADGFVAVWEDNRVGPNLRGRQIAATGELLGEEIAIDAGNGSENTYPDVVALGSGFVAVWRQDDASDEEPPRIVARLLDGNGTPIGDEFAIDTPRELDLDEYYLSAPRVAADDEGFVVVWASGTEIQSPYSAEYDTKVFSRRFSKLGAATDDDVPAFASSGAQFEPDINTTESGFVVVARSAYYFAYSQGDIVAQRLDSAGAPFGEVFQITYGHNAAPLVAAHASDVVVLWNAVQSGFVPDGTAPGLRGQRIGLSGDVLSDVFAINTVLQTSDTRLRERESAAAALGQDRFVAGWTGGESAVVDQTQGLWAQAFESDGRRASPRRKINETSDEDVAHPDLAVFGTSRMAMVWDNGSDVFVRTFAIVTAECGDADGNGAVTSTDALTAIRAAVGTSPCAPCICDADGSGAHAATDALVVLREAVGIPAALACPICTEGPGTAFRLQADRDCYGAHIEIPRDALPANLDLLSCTTDPSLVPLACNASLQVDDDGVVFDMRNCAYRNTVFSCIMPAAATAVFAQQASVQCGCGCGDCPTAPKLCTTGVAGESCSATPTALPAATPATLPASLPEALPASRPERPSSSTSAPTRVASNAETITSTTTTQAIQISTTTSSSVSFCGTCCNLEELGQIEMASPSPAPLTELLVRVKSDYRGDCVYCFRDLAGYTGEVDAYNDYWGSGGDSVSICILDHNGFDAEGVVAGCEGHGLFETGAATVVHARGMNFETIDPLPSVVVNPVPE